MLSTATARYIRVSPRKARQVVDLVRGKDVTAALAILANVNKGATVHVEEVLQSAVSNAQRKRSEVAPADLYISKFTVDGGPSLVRYRAASMGRAGMIRHRTSHLNVELDIKEEAKESLAKKKKHKR
jgi:large subunit ribosomal protein L22